MIFVAFQPGRVYDGPIYAIDTKDFNLPESKGDGDLFIDILHEGGLDLDVDDSIAIPP